MAKVIKIGISKIRGDKITELKSVEVISGKGLVNDRYFKEENDKKCQITLIEKENIDYYNMKSNTNILEINFRRNIITEGIQLNNLVGKEFFIGNVKIKGHDLCRPCKNLQNNLKKSDIIKEFLYKGGLRCEILTSGKISVGDLIK